MRHVMPTGACLPHQFQLADVAAYALLEVNALPADCAGRTGRLAHDTEFALGNAANAPEADQRDNPESCAKRARIAAIKSRHQEAGGEESNQD